MAQPGPDPAWADFVLFLVVAGLPLSVAMPILDLAWVWPILDAGSGRFGNGAILDAGSGRFLAIPE